MVKCFTRAQLPPKKNFLCRKKQVDMVVKVRKSLLMSIVVPSDQARSLIAVFIFDRYFLHDEVSTFPSL